MDPPFAPRDAFAAQPSTSAPAQARARPLEGTRDTAPTGAETRGGPTPRSRPQAASQKS